MKWRWKLAYWIMRRRKRYAISVEDIRRHLEEGWVDIEVAPGEYHLDKPLEITKPCILNGNGAEFVAPDTIIHFSKRKKKGPVMIKKCGFRAEQFVIEKVK